MVFEKPFSDSWTDGSANLSLSFVTALGSGAMEADGFTGADISLECLAVARLSLLPSFKVSLVVFIREENLGMDFAWNPSSIAVEMFLKDLIRTLRSSSRLKR